VPTEPSAVSDGDGRVGDVVATLLAEFGDAVDASGVADIVRAAEAVLLGQVPQAALPELTYRLAAHQLGAVLGRRGADTA
jgi:hypothetical protein